MSVFMGLCITRDGPFYILVLYPTAGPLTSIRFRARKKRLITIIYLRKQNSENHCPAFCYVSIDRLGGNHKEPQNQWRILTEKKEIDNCPV